MSFVFKFENIFMELHSWNFSIFIICIQECYLKLGGRHITHTYFAPDLWLLRRMSKEYKFPILKLSNIVLTTIRNVSYVDSLRCTAYWCITSNIFLSFLNIQVTVVFHTFHHNNKSLYKYVLSLDITIRGISGRWREVLFYM